jgi:ribonucleoside-triphosphate reductase
MNGVPSKIDSKPANHMFSAMQQIVNYIGVMSLEWAGAQAFNQVDTCLAPFIRKDKMTDKEIEQCIQTLLFSINIPSRWGGQ